MEPIDDDTSRQEYDEVEASLDQKWEIEDANREPYTAKDWKENNDTAKCYDMKRLMVSCGTVTIRQHSKSSQVLVLYNNKHKSYQLPKGRKQLHENPADAALRETQEESGVQVQPLFLRFDTRIEAVPDNDDNDDNNNTAIDKGCFVSANEDCTFTAVNRDMIYAMGYGDKKTRAYRHIYFYAAQPVGNGVPDPALVSEEDRFMHDVRWFSFEEARRRLTMKAERAAVITAQILYQRTRSDKECWALSKRLLENWQAADAVRRWWLSRKKGVAVGAVYKVVRSIAADKEKASSITDTLKIVLGDSVEAECIVQILRRLGGVEE